MPNAERHSVVIAGGGVAGLEALLALRELAGEQLAVELIAPSPEFLYRPMLVAEAFGLASAQRIDLERAATEHGARFHRDAVAAVDAGAREASTLSGRTFAYDSLLIATGTRQSERVPGALTFGDGDVHAVFRPLLERLEHHEISRVAFAIPDSVWWSLPAYELALLTAAYLRAWDVTPARLSVVTHEEAPLAVFGPGGSRAVAGLLDDAGIDFAGDRHPLAFGDGELALEGTGAMAADAVVALPGFEVPEIPGIPQRGHGLIPVDVRMNVEGTTTVWAAGDVTLFPIKQGGMAAQQADVAAAGIAARAGVHAGGETFQPLLRGALITGTLPLYLRSPPWGRDAGPEVASSALWRPSAKIGGRHLAPYAARLAGDEPSGALTDVSAAGEHDNQDALDFALAAADADAQARDFEGALGWLEVAEEIALALPPGYAERRRLWSAAAAAP